MANVPLMFQPLVKYADFNGRSRRSEFWLWVLFRLIVNIGLGIVVFSVVGPAFATLSDEPEAFVTRYLTVSPLLSLVGLGLLLPTLAVSVRRLHDTGRSGWWIVMPPVVSIIGLVVFFVFFGASIYGMAAATGGAEPSEAEALRMVLQAFGSLFAFVLLPSLIASIVMLVFYCTDGKAGANRFGDDPKGRNSGASVF